MRVRREPAHPAPRWRFPVPGLRVESAIREAIARLADEARRGGMRVDTIAPPMPPSEQHGAWVAVYELARASGGRWRSAGPVANRARAARAAWDVLLSDHDAVVLPTAICAAFSHRATGTPIDVDRARIPYWGLARYTEAFNLTGHPAITFPVGLDAAGLPIGVQVVGRFGADVWLVKAAAWMSELMGPIPGAAR